MDDSVFDAGDASLFLSDVDDASRDGAKTESRAHRLHLDKTCEEAWVVELSSCLDERE